VCSYFLIKGTNKNNAGKCNSALLVYTSTESGYFPTEPEPFEMHQLSLWGKNKRVNRSFCSANLKKQIRVSIPGCAEEWLELEGG